MMHVLGSLRLTVRTFQLDGNDGKTQTPGRYAGIVEELACMQAAGRHVAYSVRRRAP